MFWTLSFLSFPISSYSLVHSFPLGLHPFFSVFRSNQQTKEYQGIFAFTFSFWSVWFHRACHGLIILHQTSHLNCSGSLLTPCLYRCFQIVSVSHLRCWLLDEYHFEDHPVKPHDFEWLRTILLNPLMLTLVTRLEKQSHATECSDQVTGIHARPLRTPVCFLLWKFCTGINQHKCCFMAP